MKNKTLLYSCIINKNLEEVYRFHTDTQNLLRITPDWIDVSIESMDLPLTQGSLIVLNIKRFNITTKWVMQLEELTPFTTISDKMIKGPFKEFLHQRKFTSVSDEQTLMEERITLVLPFGWIGNLFFNFIKRDMDKMFAYRHRATKACLDQISKTG